MQRPELPDRARVAAPLPGVGGAESGDDRRAGALVGDRNPEVAELPRLQLLDHHPGRVREVRRARRVAGRGVRVAVAPRGGGQAIGRQEGEERRVLRANLLVAGQAEQLRRLAHVGLRPDVEHGERAALRIAGLRERDVEDDDRQREDDALRVHRDGSAAPVTCRAWFRREHRLRATAAGSAAPRDGRCRPTGSARPARARTRSGRSTGSAAAPRSGRAPWCRPSARPAWRPRRRPARCPPRRSARRSATCLTRRAACPWPGCPGRTGTRRPWGGGSQMGCCSAGGRERSDDDRREGQAADHRRSLARTVRRPRRRRRSCRR